MLQSDQKVKAFRAAVSPLTWMSVKIDINMLCMQDSLKIKQNRKDLARPICKKYINLKFKMVWIRPGTLLVPCLLLSWGTPGCTLGKRQAAGGVVMLWAMFYWETSSSANLVDVTVMVRGRILGSRVWLAQDNVLWQWTQKHFQWSKSIPGRVSPEPGP